ncbi:MAG: type II toxin-antitoxin system death-on-curing family toxin [Candidatus Dependentiae bacterium]
MHCIIFLTIQEVLAIHDDQILRFGGLKGIRSQALLESTLSQPQVFFDNVYLHKDLYEMAACYLFGIIKNHPFLDGNKRTGIICAILFLRYNRVKIQPSQEDFYKLAFEVASSKKNKDEIVQELKKHVDFDA